MIFLCFYLVVFLVHSYVFLRAFSGAVFSCFLSCFFWCLLVILLVVFFVLFLVLFSLCSGAFFRAFFRACPFSFLYTFPLGGGPVFCRAFFRVFLVFFPCFFSCFLWCFFVSFIVLFFVHLFVLFLVFFFEFFFFRALGGTRDKQPQYFAFWPVLFSVLFLVVTTSEDRIYTIYIYNFMISDIKECHWLQNAFWLGTILPHPVASASFWVNKCGLWLQFSLRRKLFKGLQTKKKILSIGINHFFTAVFRKIAWQWIVVT